MVLQAQGNNNVPCQQPFESTSRQLRAEAWNPGDDAQEFECGSTMAGLGLPDKAFSQGDRGQGTSMFMTFRTLAILRSRTCKMQQGRKSWSRVPSLGIARYLAMAGSQSNTKEPESGGTLRRTLLYWASSQVPRQFHEARWA